MVFTDVFEERHVEYELEQKHGVEFAPIPFNDGHGQTTYWISRDGLHVYVGTTFCGWVQCKEIKIYPARYRSNQSAPAFKRRNAKGSQCYVSVPSAVYGAFMLKDEMPRFQLSFKDGNIANCELDNLCVADESVLSINLQKFQEVYRCHSKVTKLVCANVSGITFEQAQDYVSDAFLRMCQSRIEVVNAFGLWSFLAKENSIRCRKRDRLRFDVDNILDEATSDDKPFEIGLQKYLPQELVKTLRLLYEGFTQKEIGKMLNIVPSAVSNRLKKIRTIIKQIESKE